ncbi:MAG: Rrf2 family transcriptional regulator, partial [Gammaproteobacteria bacterium]
PEEITVAEVILAVDEPIDATGCQGTEDCQKGSICLAHNLWLGLSESIYDYLNKISLAEVISQQEIRRLAYMQDAPKFADSTTEQRQQGAGDIPAEVRV